MEHFRQRGRMVNEFEKRYTPFSGCSGLAEEMRQLCAAVQFLSNGDRISVAQYFTKIICGQNPSVDVMCFGSSSTGLFVHESDLDLVILAPGNQLQEGHVAFLTKICSQLRTDPRALRLKDVQVHSAPAIPYIKAVDMQSGLEVGIICAEPGSRASGLHNSQWIRSAIAQYPSVTQLVVTLKKLLRHNNLPNITAGGISSYVLTLMAISYMQHAELEYNLGDLLLGFLELYGRSFDYESKAIVLTNGGLILDKQQLRRMVDPLRHKLIIQDPVDSTKNAAKTSLGGLGRVREVFKMAYEALHRLVSQSLSGEGFDSFLAVIFDIDGLYLDDNRNDEDDNDQFDLGDDRDIDYDDSSSRDKITDIGWMGVSSRAVFSYILLLIKTTC